MVFIQVSVKCDQVHRMYTSAVSVVDTDSLTYDALAK